jgi:enoyl-CoA hydratase/carnithine racemase
MDYQEILVEKQDRVTIITINRPQVLNAVSGPLSQEMDHALNQFQDDPQAWVCILTGAGEKAFSAGMDLKWFNENGAENYRRIMGKLQGLGGITKRHACYKPLIAAVNGHCIGYGLTAVVACDFVLASERATFAWPEVTLGIPTIVGAIRLPRRVAWADAMELLLTGETIDAGRAAAMGLVWRISDHDRLMDDARSLADRLCNAAPLAARATKEVAVRTRTMPWTEAVRFGETMRMVAAATDDATEGLQARADRRPPEWQGR